MVVLLVDVMELRRSVYLLIGGDLCDSHVTLATTRGERRQTKNSPSSTIHSLTKLHF